MKKLVLAFTLLILAACNSNPEVKQVTNDPPKGELAFLLKYNGDMPSEVGFLTNHIVERRLANMMKDSFSVFMRKARFDRPVTVFENDKLVMATFYEDSDRTIFSASLVIDVAKDAFWASYLNGDSTIRFADHPSLPNPGMD